MQGQSPTIHSHSSPTQNANREWTCQRWFHNIAAKVSAKTHQYVGWFVAVASTPFTFIPSLACDLYHGTKDIYQRTVSKAPVQSQVSTRGAPASRPGESQSGTAEIKQLRQDNSELGRQVTELRRQVTELNASAQNNDRRLSRQTQYIHELTGQLRKIHLDCTNANNSLEIANAKVAEMQRNLEKDHVQRIELQKQLEEASAINFRHTDEIKGLNEANKALEEDKRVLAKIIEDLKIELHELQGTQPSVTDHTDNPSPEECDIRSSGSEPKIKIIDEDLEDSTVKNNEVTEDGTSDSSDGSFETVRASDLNPMQDVTNS